MDRSNGIWRWDCELVVLQLTARVINAGFSARDALSAKAQVTGRVLAPVGDRIGFTHIAPDVQPDPDTFVAVLSTIVVCMVVFGKKGRGIEAGRRLNFIVDQAIQVL